MLTQCLPSCQAYWLEHRVELMRLESFRTMAACILPAWSAYTSVVVSYDQIQLLVRTDMVDRFFELTLVE